MNKEKSAFIKRIEQTLVNTGLLPKADAPETFAGENKLREKALAEFEPTESELNEMFYSRNPEPMGINIAIGVLGKHLDKSALMYNSWKDLIADAFIKETKKGVATWPSLDDAIIDAAHTAAKGFLDRLIGNKTPLELTETNRAAIIPEKVLIDALENDKAFYENFVNDLKLSSIGAFSELSTRYLQDFQKENFYKILIERFLKAIDRRAKWIEAAGRETQYEVKKVVEKINEHTVAIYPPAGDLKSWKEFHENKGGLTELQHLMEGKAPNVKVGETVLYCHINGKPACAAIVTAVLANDALDLWVFPPVSDYHKSVPYQVVASYYQKFSVGHWHKEIPVTQF